MKNKLKSFFSFINRVLIKLFLKYYQFKTTFALTLICDNFGRRICFIKPISITYSCLNLGSFIQVRNNARIEGVYKYQGVNFKPVIRIENEVSIEQNVHITCAESIIIQSGTAIASNVTITDIIHPYEDIRLSPEKQIINTKSVLIGEDCKIYNNSVILPGVKIGKHSIIGANSVVNMNIPDFCVAVGSPAKIVRRFDFDKKTWRKTNSKGEFIEI
jgi:acetyltransferase-like isoleucine patch superfamily enzyme